jgi:hypothetical protein
MKGLGISALFALVAGILSYGILVPPELQAFNLLAAAGAMSGCSVGQIVAKRVQTAAVRTILIMLSLLITVSSVLSYVRLVQSGSAEVWEIVFLGALITTMLFAFCFLMAMAGIVIEKDWFPGRAEGS